MCLLEVRSYAISQYSSKTAINFCIVKRDVTRLLKKRPVYDSWPYLVDLTSR